MNETRLYALYIHSLSLHFANLCEFVVSYPELQSDFTMQIKMLPGVTDESVEKDMVRW